MRRVGRYILNCLAVVLLLAWVVATVTRLRYNYVPPPPSAAGIGLFGGPTHEPDHGPEHWVEWYDGSLEIGVDARGDFPADPKRDRHWRVLGVEHEHIEQDNLTPGPNLFGDLPELPRRGNYTYSLLRVPYWLMSAMLLAFPSWRVVQLCRRRSRLLRARRGYCPICSYDLRATPGRCPECGTVTLQAKV